MSKPKSSRNSRSGDMRADAVDHRPWKRRLLVMGLRLLALWFAVRSGPSQLTAEETTVLGVWQTAPLEDGHRTLMTLTPARRCRIRVIRADETFRDGLQGTWSMRDGLLTVDTRSYLECLPGPIRLRGPGEIWTFAVEGDRLVYGPQGPRTILLERMP